MPSDRSVDGRNDLHRAGGLEDLTAAVAGEVVAEHLDAVGAVLLGRLRLAQADGRDLGI